MYQQTNIHVQHMTTPFFHTISFDIFTHAIDVLVTNKPKLKKKVTTLFVCNNMNIYSNYQ